MLLTSFAARLIKIKTVTLTFLFIPNMQGSLWAEAVAGDVVVAVVVVEEVVAVAVEHGFLTHYVVVSHYHHHKTAF